jgi:hypothetical protein
MVLEVSGDCHGEVRKMSWTTYYVEVSMRQREDEIARRIARERQQRQQVRAARGRRHWWSLRRSAATRRPALRSGEAAGRRAASLSTSRS